ncbi:DegT/DnrJ/EryC1/StrS family aminotransferase [Candidatus Pacearchaeota archaeon]|nr:DegT/DnrJ/EryC1/StrS family aminotransferase [Candidatus Pacearchaeota archaeon]
MKIPFGNLKRHYQRIKHEIDQSLVNVLESGWFVLGKQVEEFEKEFTAYCGLPYGVGVNSGTDALYLALLICGVGKEDEVITVPNTAVPTVCAIRMAGARPVFCDVQEDTLLMNPILIKRLITRKTKAIIPVHLYGQMCDMDKIMEVANEYSLKVVEDACQAHGAEWKGLKSGNFGDAACYSYYPSKNLGAFGDGGMIVTKDETFSDKIKMLRNYGQKERYYNVIEGINSRLDEIQAAVLRAMLSHLDEWNRRRREIADHYCSSNNNPDIKHPIEEKVAKHVFHLYVIRIKSRENLQRYLNNHGIETIIHYPLPIYKQQAYSHLNVSNVHCPVAEKAAEQILSIPIYPELTDEEVKYIIDCLNSWEG